MYRTITHEQHINDYAAGVDAMDRDIKELGKEEAAKKWRLDNQGNPSSLAAYYYAEGGLDTLAIHY